MILGNAIQVDVPKGQKLVWQALVDSQGNSQVTIDNNANIDLSGLWLNQLEDAKADTSVLAFLNGGTLNVATTGGVTFAAGSIIDVSSGAAILANGKMQVGRGGNVSLIANDDTHARAWPPIRPHSSWLMARSSLTASTVVARLTLKAGQTVVIGEDATLDTGSCRQEPPAPASTRLADQVTIPAGSKIPLDYTLVSSSTSGRYAVDHELYACHRDSEPRAKKQTG